MTTTTYIDRETAKRFGIDILTGEACALSMRMLCEVTEDMMQTILDYNGLRVDINTLSKSWHNDKDKYAVFLTWEAIEDLVIMKLVELDGYVVEILPNQSECKNAGCRGKKHLLSGDMEEIREQVNNCNHLYTKYIYNEETGKTDVTQGLYDVGRSYHIYQAQPHRGFSNVHAMTGMAQ